MIFNRFDFVLAISRIEKEYWASILKNNKKHGAKIDFEYLH